MKFLSILMVGVALTISVFAKDEAEIEALQAVQELQRLTNELIEKHQAEFEKPKNNLKLAAKLKPLTESLSAQSLLSVYRGIPRENPDAPLNQNPANADEVRTLSRFGQTFYEKPLQVNSDRIPKLLVLLKNPKSFSQWSGEKPCGGFRPDYALVWKTGDLITEMHLCFTCKEIKLYRGHTRFLCDLTQVTCQSLRDWVRKLN